MILRNLIDDLFHEMDIMQAPISKKANILRAMIDKNMELYNLNLELIEADQEHTNNLYIDLSCKYDERCEEIGRLKAELERLQGVTANWGFQNHIDSLQVLNEIANERAHQDKKWGGPTVDDTRLPSQWLEFIRARIHFGNYNYEYQRRQMVEIAALAVAHIQSMDRIRNQSA